jgi:hypothetical protein
VSEQGRARRDFNARSFALGLVSLVLLAVWSHWHNVIAVNRTSLNDGSPPVGAVGVFLGVFLLVALWEVVNRRVRLPRGELVVIYAMLMVAAPWMSHGIWYRFVGLIFTIPRDADQERLYPYYSDKLWPHGPQLNLNRDFARGFEGYHLTIAPTKDDEDAEAPLPEPDGRVTTGAAQAPGQGYDRCVALRTQDVEILKFRCRIPTRSAAGEVQVVPGENYLLSYAARIREARGSTLLTCYLLTDRKDKTSINTLNRDTKVSFSTPDAFQPVHQPKVLVPDRLGEYLDIVFEFKGAGTLQLADIRFYNNEAIQSLYQGRLEVRAADLERLPPNERARVDVRPDSLWTLSGLAYRLRGNIPLDQWAEPAILWSSLILVLYLAIMAVMVILRRQWAEHERFGFPMLILPRTLLEEESGPDGCFRFVVFRRRSTWVGFGIALFLILLRGLHHYFDTPYLKTELEITKFVENHRPLLSFFRGFYPHPFNLSLVMLPIAFFIELELLGSILLCFVVCSLPFYLREDLFTSWRSVKDFPFIFQQHTGAYVALAVIALYAGRRHLWDVLRRIAGRHGAVDDRGEAWSYRTAAGILALAVGFLCFWMQYVGVGFWKGALYVAFLLACAISTARIRAECGTPWTYLTPYTPLIIFTALGGAHFFGVELFVIMIVSGGFLCSASYLMCAPTQVEMLQLGRLLDVSPRCLNRAMMLGAVGGLVFGGLFLLSIAYGKGGMNMPYIGDWAAQQAFQIRIVTTEVAYQDQRFQKCQDEKRSFGFDLKKPDTWALGVSFGITILLFAAKSLWVGFPLHPVGYILANSYFINMVWGSLLAALVIKFIALKAGGVMVVRNVLRPFFVGMFVGAVAGYVLWDVVALVLQACGHMDTFHVPHVF